MHSRQLIVAADLASAREAFHALSEKMLSLLTIFGNPLAETVRVAHCPMAFGHGADWAQRGEEVRNVYYGSEMLTCGDITSTLAPGAHLGAEAEAPSEESGEAEPSPPAGSRGAHAQAASGMRARPATPTETVAEPSEAPEAAFRRELAAVMTPYLRAQRAMAGDDLDAAKVAARGVSAAVARVTAPPDRQAAWAALRPALASAAARVSGAADLASAQRAFIPLGAAATKLVRDLGNPLGSALRVAHCPMRNADWVQSSATIQNPFFGSNMPTCGSVTSTVPPMGDGR
jgi:Cu(I)/Ag(I) efflux system membrane fusion protein